MPDTQPAQPIFDFDLLTVASDVLTFVAVDTIYVNKSFEGLSSAFNGSKLMDGLVLAASALVSKYVHDWLTTPGVKGIATIQEPQNQMVRAAIPAAIAGATYGVITSFARSNGRSFMSNVIGGSLSIFISRQFVDKQVHNLLDNPPVK